AVVDALADLHLVDPAAVDLADLGRPDGFLERQLRGWTKRWELAALPDSDPAMQVVADRLTATMPQSRYVAILHNDYKLDNCQFDPADPDRVQSIFDWDMTTLGDPLIDLGTLLNYWPDPADPPGAGRVSHAGLLTIGLPGRDAITARYAERTGLDVSTIGWYEAFALWKTGVVLQQLHERWRRGESTDPRMATIADRLPRVAAAAAALLD
ncbi:MAG: phosphotransferase family protein, partial [Ilumatobacteraceae bacterium]